MKLFKLSRLALWPKLAMVLACAGIAGAFSEPTAADAQTGKPLTIYIGTPAGGGYDLYGRLVARYLGRFLPGDPSVVVENMPGAGSVIMTNWLYNEAPQDGTAIGLVPTSTAFERVLGDSSAKYDARRFHWLASLAEFTPIAIVWSKTPYKSAEDLLTKPIVIGASGADSDVTVWPRLVNSVLGAHLNIVPGYNGTSQLNLAMENGEIQGSVGADWQGLNLTKPDWVRDSKVRVLMQFGATRIADLPKVPTALEFAKSKRATDILSLLAAREKYGRSFAAPPGTPGTVVANLRSAFNRMIRDPQFLSDAKKLHATIDYASGKDVQGLVQQVYSMSPSVLHEAAKELGNLNK